MFSAKTAGATAIPVPAPGGVQRLTRVVETVAHEGTVYVAGEDALYFTTPRPDVAINRLALDGCRFPRSERPKCR
jgi:hypothetical protein